VVSKVKVAAFAAAAVNNMYVMAAAKPGKFFIDYSASKPAQSVTPFCLSSSKKRLKAVALDQRQQRAILDATHSMLTTVRMSC
jgi:hypothetical protein